MNIFRNIDNEFFVCIQDCDGGPCITCLSCGLGIDHRKIRSHRLTCVLQEDEM